MELPTNTYEYYLKYSRFSLTQYTSFQIISKTRYKKRAQLEAVKSRQTKVPITAGEFDKMVNSGKAHSLGTSVEIVRIDPWSHGVAFAQICLFVLINRLNLGF